MMWMALVQSFMETYGGYDLDDVLDEDFGVIMELLRVRAKIKEDAEKKSKQKKNNQSAIPGGARGRPPT